MRARAVLLALALLGCGAPARTPEDTVRLYLHAVAADPIRSLELLTDGFHRRHGLRFEEVGDAAFAAPTRATSSGDAALELERARLGWLTVLTKRIFAHQSPRFEHRLGATAGSGARAAVPVQVREGGRPVLDATFRLLRAEPDGPWRIDAIEVTELGGRRPVAAYLIAPDVERHRRIAELSEQRRGRAGAGPPTAGSR